MWPFTPKSEHEPSLWLEEAAFGKEYSRKPGFIDKTKGSLLKLFIGKTAGKPNPDSLPDNATSDSVYVNQLESELREREFTPAEKRNDSQLKLAEAIDYGLSKVTDESYLNVNTEIIIPSDTTRDGSVVEIRKTGHLDNNPEIISKFYEIKVHDSQNSPDKSIIYSLNVHNHPNMPGADSAILLPTNGISASEAPLTKTIGAIDALTKDIHAHVAMSLAQSK